MLLELSESDIPTLLIEELMLLRVLFEPNVMTIPKPLLKAGELRLIEYSIIALVEAGVDEIIINTAYLPEQFPQLLGNGSNYGVNLVYSPEPAGGLETAGGIINALPLLGDKPFLVVNGDIWTDYPLKPLSKMTLADNVLCHLILVNNPPHHPDGDFALDAGLVQAEGEPKYTYSGIGLYHPALFAGLAVQRYRLKPVFLAAMSKQQISGEHYQGQWSDIGTVQRLQQLDEQLKTKL